MDGFGIYLGSGADRLHVQGCGKEGFGMWT